MWERAELQGPGRQARGLQRQAPPGRREATQRCDSAGRSAPRQREVGPSPQVTLSDSPSPPHMLSSANLELIIPHHSAFSVPSGTTSPSIEFSPQWGSKQAFPQGPRQHFLRPGHSESILQASGGFIMAHCIIAWGHTPGLTGPLYGLCTWAGYGGLG